MVPSAPAWSLRLSACCLWLARMFYLPFRKVLSYMNTSATVHRANISTTTGSHQATCSQWLRQQLTRPRRSQAHRSCKRNDTKPDYDSAIGQHLLDNDRCALNYDDKRFSILTAARSSFHYNLLEATYIKTRCPVLCRQKEFIYTLKLFR